MYALPEALATTNRVCASVACGSTKAGINADFEAGANAKVKAGGMMTVEGGAMTIIKGALVKIN